MPWHIVEMSDEGLDVILPYSWMGSSVPAPPISGILTRRDKRVENPSFSARFVSSLSIKWIQVTKIAGFRGPTLVIDLIAAAAAAAAAAALPSAGFRPEMESFLSYWIWLFCFSIRVGRDKMPCDPFRLFYSLFFLFFPIIEYLRIWRKWIDWSQSRNRLFFLIYFLSLFKKLIYTLWSMFDRSRWDWIDESNQNTNFNVQIIELCWNQKGRRNRLSQVTKSTFLFLSSATPQSEFSCGFRQFRSKSVRKIYIFK